MKVLGFDIDFYNRSALEEMTDKALYQLYLDENKGIILFDSPQQFFTDLNDEYVDTENYWYYFVKIN